MATDQPRPDASAQALEDVHKILFEDAALSNEHRMQRVHAVITKARQAAVALPQDENDDEVLKTGTWLAQRHRHACHDSLGDHECAECRAFSAMLAQQQALLAERENLKRRQERVIAKLEAMNPWQLMGVERMLEMVRDA